MCAHISTSGDPIHNGATCHSQNTLSLVIKACTAVLLGTRFGYWARAELEGTLPVIPLRPRSALLAT